MKSLFLLVYLASFGQEVVGNVKSVSAMANSLNKQLIVLKRSIPKLRSMTDEPNVQYIAGELQAGLNKMTNKIDDRTSHLMLVAGKANPDTVPTDHPVSRYFKDRAIRELIMEGELDDKEVGELLAQVRNEIRRAHWKPVVDLVNAY